MRLALIRSDNRVLMKRLLALMICSIGLAGFSWQIQSQRSIPEQFQILTQQSHAFDGEFTVESKPIKLTTFGRSNLRFEALVAVHESAARMMIRYDGSQELSTGNHYSATMMVSDVVAKDRVPVSVVLQSEPKLIHKASADLVSNIRQAFIQNTAAVDAESLALVLGLSIGERSATPEKLAADMKTVSLTHLMAVSGANCAIVAGVIFLALSKIRVSRFVRAMISTLAIVGYVELVGPEPSVVRAGFMAITVVLAVSVGRKPTPISALGFAVLCLLIIDPWLAVDFGFLLSVGATAGILILTPALYERLKRKLPRYFALALSVSIGAQVFCLPVLLQLQDGLPTYSVLANVLAEPLVAPVTVLGIAACSLAWLLPGVSVLLTYLASLATWCIAQLSHYFAALPWATLNWLSGAIASLVAVLIAVLLLIWLKTKNHKWRTLSAVTLIIILACTSMAQIPIKRVASSWPPNGWQVVQCDVGQGDALVLRSGQSVAVIDVGRDDEPIDECLTELQVRRIDLLVLTHFDLDHVGGLAGALKGRIVGHALISPFDDPRWAATRSLDQLRLSGAKVTVANQATTGRLGEVQWRVIGPAVPNSQIEDSNDGSLVMFWSFSAFSLLTMADAGERSQQFIASKSISWLSRAAESKPLIVKVSHHGSADQFAEFIEALSPEVSLISVGQGNSYGHPTSRTLRLLEGLNSKVLRTDQDGAVAIDSSADGIHFSTTGEG